MGDWKRVKRIVMRGLGATDDSFKQNGWNKPHSKAPFTHDLGLVTWESETCWHWP